MTTPAPSKRLLSVAAVMAAITAVVMGIGGTAHAEGEDACTASSFRFGQVEAACTQGGRKAAKDLMKKAVKKAKAAGETMNCKSCHTELKTFALTPNAVSDLEPWL